MEAGELIRVSEDEYIAWERVAETKSELIDGEIVAMAGGSTRHDAMAAKIAWLMDRHASASDPRCVVFDRDQKLHVESTGLFTYSDACVVRGEPRFHRKFSDVLVNPGVIVEVISRPAESYDRGPKFLHYQTISSLSEYVLVEQYERRVDHFRRLETGQWLLTVHEGDEAVLELPLLGCTISLAEIYTPIDSLDPDVT